MIKPQNIPNIHKTKCGCKITKRHIIFTNKRRIEINAQMMEADYQKKKNKARKELNNIVLPTLDYDPNSQKMIIMAGTAIIAKTKQKKTKKH